MNVNLPGHSARICQIVIHINMNNLVFVNSESLQRDYSSLGDRIRALYRGAVQGCAQGCCSMHASLLLHPFIDSIVNIALSFHQQHDNQSIHRLSVRLLVATTTAAPRKCCTAAASIQGGLVAACRASTESEAGYRTVVNMGTWYQLRAG